MKSTYAQKSSTLQKAAAPNASSVFDSSPQSESLQRKADMANIAAQRAETPRPNNTGMPDNLKAGIESLSGFSMDDVRVHYNSSKPATVQALAYTQGTDIHVAPGQEKCLPHEAWHVAQQMAGRVSPTTNINGMPVNDNAALEHEADVMGEKAVRQRKEQDVSKKHSVQSTALSNSKVMQQLLFPGHGKISTLGQLRRQIDSKGKIFQDDGSEILGINIDEFKDLPDEISISRCTNQHDLFILLNEKLHKQTAVTEGLIMFRSYGISKILTGCELRNIVGCVRVMFNHTITSGGGTSFSYNGETIFHVSQGPRSDREGVVNEKACTILFVHNDKSLGKKMIVGIANHMGESTYSVKWCKEGAPFRLGVPIKL